MLVVACTASSIVRPAHAQPGQPTPPTSPGAIRDIDELSLGDLLDRRVSIASAGRVLRVEEAPSLVTVVTDEDIRRLGARTVSEVLRTVPGFDVMTTPNGANLIVVRGKRPFQDSNVLILLDGQRLNDALTNDVLYYQRSIPLSYIRQIEVVRGPASAVYGAYAFGGVVNIVTHTPQTLAGVQVEAQGGSFGTSRASVVTGHAIGGLSLSTAIDASGTSGPRLPVAADLATVIDRLVSTQTGLAPASRAPATTRDAVRALDLRVGAAWRGTTLDLYARGDERRGGYLGILDILPTDDRTHSRLFGGDVNHRVALGSRGGVRVAGSYVQNAITSHYTPVPAGFAHLFADGVLTTFPRGGILDATYGSRRMQGTAVLDYALGRADQLVVGAEAQREATFDEEAASNYDFRRRTVGPGVVPVAPVVPPSARTIASAFVQESWNPVPSLGLTAGVRHDQYSDVGGTTNPRLGVVWRLPNAWYAKALYGRAFKAPTFEQLYQDLPRLRIGDRSLRPTTIETRELAAGWARGGVRVGADYFAESMRDRVIPAFDTVESVVSGAEFVFANAAPLRTRGVELEARTSIGLDHALFGTYTYQAVRVAGTPGLAPEVPRALANVGATTGLGRHVSATLVAHWRGPVERSATDLRRDAAIVQALGLDLAPRVKARTVANLNVRLLNLWDTFELATTVENLFDARYVDPSIENGAPFDYPQPGRGVYVKAGYRF